MFFVTLAPRLVARGKKDHKTPFTEQDMVDSIKAFVQPVLARIALRTVAGLVGKFDKMVAKLEKASITLDTEVDRKRVQLRQARAEFENERLAALLRFDAAEAELSQTIYKVREESQRARRTAERIASITQ